MEDTLIHDVNANYGLLSEEERKMLSKVLFPDSQMQPVNIMGKVRDLTPMPVKWAKKLRAAMLPFSDKLAAAQKDPTAASEDMALLEAIAQCCRVICDRYGWEDIKQALDDEELTSSDMQALVVAQTSLQGSNDFLVTPLRIACMVMQVVEMQAVKLQSMFGGHQPLKL